MNKRITKFHANQPVSKTSTEQRGRNRKKDLGITQSTLHRTRFLNAPIYMGPDIELTSTIKVSNEQAVIRELNAKLKGKIVELRDLDRVRKVLISKIYVDPDSMAREIQFEGFFLTEDHDDSYDHEHSLNGSMGSPIIFRSPLSKKDKDDYCGERLNMIDFIADSYEGLARLRDLVSGKRITLLNNFQAAKSFTVDKVLFDDQSEKASFITTDGEQISFNNQSVIVKPELDENALNTYVFFSPKMNEEGKYIFHRTQNSIPRPEKGSIVKASVYDASASVVAEGSGEFSCLKVPEDGFGMMELGLLGLRYPTIQMNARFSWDDDKILVLQLLENPKPQS